MTDDPAIKTPQLAHQEEFYLEHRDDKHFAVLWEMGLGKSKLMLDIASHKFLQGQIDALVVVAPNATYPNWIRIEAPIHLAAPYVSMIYPKTDSDKDQLKRLIFTDPDEFKGKLRLLTIGFDAVAATDRALDFLSRFMRVHRTMLVIDESTAIKNPRSKTAIRLKALGAVAHSKWILTGTPTANSPFDIHSQIEFLNPEFWGWHGMKSFGAFKSVYGEFITRRYGSRSFPELKQYRRLDHLNQVLGEISSRLTKESSGVKLPPKIYELKTFEMSPAQQQAYDRVRHEIMVELDSGAEISVSLAITRMLRLQQITSGFVGVDEITDVPANSEELPWLRLLMKNRAVVDLVDPENNPRLELLKQILSEAHHKVIIWCRFTREIAQICDMIGENALRYDGQTTQANRKWALERFCDPDDHQHTRLVANVKSISHGVTLTIAKTMVYYSNDDSPEKRLQSEDRFHRIGQDRPVLIIDIAAVNSVNIKQLARLQKKFDTSAMVHGDQIRDWLRGEIS